MTSLTTGTTPSPALFTPSTRDLVAVGREAQEDPDSAAHAARVLTGACTAHPVQSSERLDRREAFLGRLGPWTGPEPVQLPGRV